MYIFATFKHANSVEICLKELIAQDIPSEAILAVPLEVTSRHVQWLDSMYHTDGKSLMDLSAVFGAILMLIGTIYGYVLPIGPVLSGLIGLLTGLTSGSVLDYYYTKRKNEIRFKQKEFADVIITIKCVAQDKRMIIHTCTTNGALAIGIFPGADSST